MSKPILVTGAAGHLGGAIVRRLLDSRGIAAADIIAGTRDPSKLGELAARGVAVRRVDFDDAASLPAAFEGAATVLIVSGDSMEPGKRLAQHLAAVDAAKRAGAQRIAYTSMPDPANSLVAFAPDHAGTEEAIRATGLPYAILRNGWYHENLFRTLPQALSSGQWVTSAGDGKVSYGARDDFAAAIAAVVANGSVDSTIETLTGPDAFTAAEVAALASEVLGKPIAVVQIDDAALRGGLAAHGLPEPVARIVVSIDASIRAGQLGHVTDRVSKLTGKAPTTLRAFLQDNRQALLG